MLAKYLKGVGICFGLLLGGYNRQVLTYATFKCITNTRFETTDVPLILADSGIEWALILSSCTSTNCNCVLNDTRFSRMSKKNPAEVLQLPSGKSKDVLQRQPKQLGIAPLKQTFERITNPFTSHGSLSHPGRSLQPSPVEWCWEAMMLSFNTWPEQKCC